MSQSIWSKKSIKPYEGIGCSDSVKVFSFLWRLRNKFSFLWKMRKKVFVFVKNEKTSSHFREKWEINSQFREKWAKKLVSHVPHFSVELSLTICIGWELKIATFVVKVQYTTIHFEKYMKKLCYSPAIRAKDLLLVQTMSSIGVS